MNKKIIGCIIVLWAAMSFALCVQASEIVDSGECGVQNNLVWALDSDGTLTISGNGEMADWKRICEKHSDTIENIVINQGVTSIGAIAFAEYKKLINVSIPDSVTYIGQQVFYNCTSLEKINIPDSVIMIDETVFLNCYSLTEISVSKDNPNYSSIDGNLFNKQETQLIQYAIGKKDGSYDIPDSVTTITSSAFENCNNIIYINNGNHITDIEERAFLGCSRLEHINLSDSITHIGAKAFLECNSLESIEIPNQITEIQNLTFTSCTNLKKISLKSNLKSIGFNAFFGCNNLLDVYYNGNEAQWTSIQIFDSTDEYSGNGNAPLINAIIHTNSIDGGSCDDNLTWLITDEGVLIVSGEGDMNGAPWAVNWDNYSRIKKVIIEEGVTSIYSMAFYGLVSVESISIPSSVINIEENFFSCYNLINIYVSDDNLKYSSSDGNLFNKDKTILIKYAIGKKDAGYSIPDRVINIADSAFSDCSNLSSVIIPKSVTHIGTHAFDKTGLSDIYYYGSDSEWQQIQIDWDYNDEINKSIKHFYTVAFPTPIIGESAIAVDNNDGTYRVNVPIANIPYNCELICTLYSNNIMSGISSKIIKSADNYAEIIIQADSASIAKVFIWDRLSGMKPLCDAKTLSTT